MTVISFHHIHFIVRQQKSPRRPIFFFSRSLSHTSTWHSVFNPEGPDLILTLFFVAKMCLSLLPHAVHFNAVSLPASMFSPPCCSESDFIVVAGKFLINWADTWDCRCMIQCFLIYSNCSIFNNCLLEFIYSNFWNCWSCRKPNLLQVNGKYCNTLAMFTWT